MGSPTPTDPEQFVAKAPSHSRVPDPRLSLSQLTLGSWECLCLCTLHHTWPTLWGRAFTLLLPLQSLSSYRRVGTGKSGNSYSISPQFPAEDAIARTWYFNIGKCWKCIPKIWEISNIPPAENLVYPSMLPSFFKATPNLNFLYL